MSNNNKSQSIRGDVVDFDLLRVKQTMEDRDKPDSVKIREKYIDIRRRRNPRRNVSDLVNEQRHNESDAREKIQKSREARIKRDAEEAEKDDDVVVEKKAPTPTVTPDVTKRTSRKKIVKRSKSEDES